MVTESDLRLADGRTIHVYDTGAEEPDARLAVFWHHGTPNIGAPPEPLFPAADRLGIRWVSYDRPGYGGSTPHPGRDVASAATDVAAVADALGIGQFAVMGHSGGAPHALACAALLSERIARAAVLVGLAPHGADGLDWFDGMAQSNVNEYTAAANSYADIVARTREVASAVRADPASLIARLHAELPDPDRRVVADRGIRSMLIETYAEALRTSDYGWIDDVVAFCSDWGFDPASIPVPVLLWHGASDVFSPASHARWLAGKIPNAAVVVQAGAAHFGALDVLPDILRWLCVGQPQDRELVKHKRSAAG